MTRTRRNFILMTLAGLVMAVLMSVLSAYIRIAESGIDCEPWPGCHAASFTIDSEPGITIGESDRFRGLRATHRFMASAFGLVSVLMLVVALWYRRELQVVLVPTLVFLVMLVLAWVGMRTPDLEHPFVMLTNLAGGMLLGALLLWQYLQLLHPGSLSFRTVNTLLLLLVFLAIASGGWVSANFAASACDDLLQCSPVFSREAFNPSRQLEIIGGVLTKTGTESGILFLHMAIGGLAALVATGWAATTWVKHRQLHGWLLIPALLLLLLGVSGMFPGIRGVTSASVHNLMALVLLLAATSLVFARRQDGPVEGDNHD